ncbi:MAG: UvrD-helicase domain-containing protein [Victivallales bacterium]|nr:UvrD-helicase domain-containing protein [Victivallales bacterium]
MEQNNHSIADAYTVPLTGKHLMEASAGTGKTYNIVTLFLRMVLAGIPLRKILVVTFTEAATAELVNRVRKGLVAMTHALEGTGQVPEQCAPFLDPSQWKDIFDKNKYPTGYGWAPNEIPEENAGKKRLKQRIRQALADFDQAAISTIHGFCRSILNENIFESGVRFGLAIQPNFNDLLYAITADYYRQQFYTVNSSFLRWLDFKQTPSSIISQKELMRLLEMPEENIQWETIPSLDWNALKEYYLNHKDILETPELEKSETAIQTWCDFEAFWGGNKHDLPVATKDITAFQEEVKKRKNEIQAQILVKLKQDALKKIREEFNRQKQERGLISFDELLTRVWDVLREEALREGERPLTERIREQYVAVLVDEFQDTDDVQYSIFEWLFAGNLHEPGQKSKATTAKLDRIFFMIGDPKQAIYSFRGGDLYTYQNAAEGVQRLTLQTNFRSSQTYIQEMNKYLENIMSHFYGENPPRWESIVSPENNPHRLLDSHGQEFTQNLLTHNTDGQEKPLECLTREILSVLHAGLRHQEKEGEEAKPLQPGDIAVLVDTNSQGKEVTEALSNAGIPCQWFGTTSIFSTPEASILLQCMQCLQNLGKRGNVLTLLSTPIFGYQAGDLYTLNETSLPQVMTALHTVSLLWQKKSFLTAFEQLLYTSRENLENGLLGNNGEETFASKILAGPNGEHVLAHFLQLTESLNAVALERHLGQQGLTDCLKKKIDANKDPSDKNKNNTEQTTVENSDNEDAEERDCIRLSSEKSAVQVMTAHKSKGLQFPIVFAYNLLQRSFKTGPGGIFHQGGKRKIYQGKLPSIPSEQDLPEQKQVIKEGYDEMLRLFYVIVTRAQYLCRFIDTKKKQEKESTQKTTFELLSKNQTSPFPYLQNLTFEETQEEPSFHGHAFAGEALDASDVHPAPGWSTISFSSLSPIHREYLPPEETDNQEKSILNDDESENEGASEDTEEDSPQIAPIFQMAAGTAAGSCWHSLFEHLDFQWVTHPEVRRDGLTFHEWLCQQLASQFRGTPEKKLAQQQACCDAIEGILCHQLPIGFALKDILPEKRATELRFTFHLKNGFLAGNLDPALNDLTPDEQSWLPKFLKLWKDGLDFPDNWSRAYRASQEHNLTGSIDLLFEHNGKTYVLDWKTNSLKNDFQNFLPERLPFAMRSSYYPFQYLLYTVAWMRFFDSLHPGHVWTEEEYLQRFGGCLYVFCRGVSRGIPGTATKWPRGFHFAPPNAPDSLLRWEVLGQLYQWLEVSPAHSNRNL